MMEEELNNTGFVDENVPNAGPTAVLMGHTLHLISRRRRSEHEPLREALSAEPSRVEADMALRHCTPIGLPCTRAALDSCHHEHQQGEP